MKITRASHTAKGFSIIEMLISIAIITIITTILLVRYNMFESQTLLTNLGYDISLSIREAQVYGLGIRDDRQGNFDSHYGIVFNVGSASYILFTDINKNNMYNHGEAINVYRIDDRRYEISEILVEGESVENVNILFKRPNPEAHIYVRQGDGTPAQKYERVEITLRAKRDDTFRKIYVANTGYISVRAQAAGI